MPRMTAATWALLLALSLLWAGAFLFNGLALPALPPLTVVALRVALAALALWAVIAATAGPLPRGARVWTAFLGMGLLNNAVPFALIAWAQTEIAVGLAAILNATTPIFTVLVAHALTADERASAAKLAGVLLGFLGVAVLVGPAASAHGPALAQAAVLAGALSYAAASVFGRRFRVLGVAPMTTAAGQVTASSALLLPLALLVDRPWTLPLPGWEAIAAVLGLALLSTALAYVLFFRILAVAGATNLMLVTFLIPPSAILLGWAVLGEVPEPRHLAGLALIAAGLAAIDGRLLRGRPAQGRAAGQSAWK